MYNRNILGAKLIFKVPPPLGSLEGNRVQKIETCEFVIPIMQSIHLYCLGRHAGISRHLECNVKLTTVLTSSFHHDLLILEVLILLLRHAYFKIYTEIYPNLIHVRSTYVTLKHYVCF